MRNVFSLTATAFLLAAIANGSEFQVTDYGAKPDGQTIDTTSIQRAIDEAARAHGTVVFKPGVYLTGALFLKSGVQFRVNEGVTIRGVQDTSAYPEMPTRIAGIEMTWPSALLNVYEQSNVRIFGKGSIDGNGKYWWDQYWALRKQYDGKGLRWAADYDCKRVRLIQIYRSSDVQLEDLTLQRSGFWTVHLCYSHDLRVDGITIRNNIGGRGPSTDGIDVDSSSHVLVQRCDIECNDDALCMKAGRDAGGLRVNQPTEDVTIRDCTVRVGAAGFTVGSETSGGIRRVDVSGLHVFAGAPNGILFKSARTRGGTVDHINVRDVHLENVAVPVRVALNWNPRYSYAQIPPGIQNVPPYYRILAQPVPTSQGMPHLRDVQISDLTATGARSAFEVSGYPSDPIEDFLFEHLNIAAKAAGTIADAENWTFIDTEIHTADGSHIVLKDCRNIKGLE
ncbi:MAG TPA: glycoside hydrolase family 28 protein [Bryobacteraceae bacterium]|nr:glycoside hydrolase family 28 protein [Bryobacteraceae bacterium]